MIYPVHRQSFRIMINIWGADHGGYIKRMQAAVKAITETAGELDVQLCQMVNLMDNGKPVKMSKRAGTFVTLREVIDKVGKDVVRFIMLTRKNDAQLDFDLTKVLEQTWLYNFTTIRYGSWSWNVSSSDYLEISWT